MHQLNTHSTSVWLLVQLCVFAIAWLVVILIDPYVGLTSGLALQAANALPVALLTIAASAITGRPLFALVLVCGAHMVLILADQAKLKVLQSHIIYADIHVVPMLIANPSLVIGFILKPLWAMVIGGLLLVVAPTAAWYCVFIRGPLQVRAILALSCFALMHFQVLPADGLIPTAPDWVAFEQGDESIHFGVLANLVYGWRSSNTAITPGDEKSRARLLSNPALVAARQELTRPAKIKPDVVVVQSESLFDTSLLCGMPDKPQLPSISSSEHASLTVPVFGGRTLQTEFETLSGVPVRSFSNAEFAYLDLLRSPVDALPAQLARMGYRTIAIHPNNRNFWRRNYAIPALGFEDFIDISAFSGIDLDKQGHVADASLISAALAELDAENKPAFIFIITMANHGPWGGRGKSELDDYIARAILADAAWRQLTEGLAKRDHPALAILYGDHLPGLADTYKSRCFKDGRPPEKHMPPVAVWANLADKLRPPPKASFLTPGWILDMARLPRSEMYAINGAVGLVAEHGGDDALASIKTDYAAVTAEWLKSYDHHDPFGAILSSEAIDHRLRSMLTEGEFGPRAPQGLMLNQVTGKGSIIRLRLDGKIRSMTFRPYPGDKQCKATEPIIVNVDGRNVGRIDGGPLATLATIHTSGAERLTLIRAPGGDSSRCATTILRVVQMQEVGDNARTKPHP